MKKLIIIPLLLLSLSLTAPTLDWRTRLDNKYDRLKYYEELLYQRELDKYAHHLAYKESRNNWKVINDYGYMGAFQHGTAILSDFGLDITPEAFRADSSIFPPELQYKVLMAQIKVQTIQLRKFDAWIGHEVGGVVITRAGMLAACHLGGYGAVKAFIRSNGVINRADANGTSISDYMREFSIYDL